MREMGLTIANPVQTDITSGLPCQCGDNCNAVLCDNCLATSG